MEGWCGVACGGARLDRHALVVEGVQLDLLPTTRRGAGAGWVPEGAARKEGRRGGRHTMRCGVRCSAVLCGAVRRAVLCAVRRFDLSAARRWRTTSRPRAHGRVTWAVTRGEARACSASMAHDQQASCSSTPSRRIEYRRASERATSRG
eukprot:1634929-Prymnesium_polylepis.1